MVSGRRQMAGGWRGLAAAVLGCLTALSSAVSAEQTISREPEDVQAKIGQTVLLPCEVSEAVGAVQWTRDEFGLGVERGLPSWPRYRMVGEARQGEHSLEIRQVTLEDDAVFQCQVGASAGVPGVRSRNAQLTVLVPPKPPRIVQGDQLATTSGVIIQIQCESRGGKPAPQLEWFEGDGTQLENNITTEERLMSDGKRSVVESTILIEPEARHHNINITCRAKNDALAEPQSTTITLHVKFPPEVTVKVDSAKITEYDDVTFTCSAIANPDQELVYEWFINDEVAVGDHGTELKLSSVGRELNNAPVRCDVTNEVGTGSHSVDLDVRYGPRFRSEPVDGSAESGQELTLKCDVDANPSPEIMWIKRDCDTCQKIVGLGSELTVTVSLSTVGRYECRASNTGFSEISRQLMVFVRSRPEVTASSPQRAAPGQTVHVQCLVSSVPPPSATTWYHYGRIVDTDSDRFQVVDEPILGGVRSLLVISRARDSDFGLYNCSFRNEYGTDSAVVLLQMQESVPLLIILSGAVGGVIVIISIILVVILCRRQRRPTGRPPGDGSEKTGTRITDDSSAGDSDLKVDLRSGSSLSGRTATGSDRWDEQSNTASLRYPDDFTDVSFPPARQDNQGGYVAFPSFSPPPMYTDPRYSARYGNPYLRGGSLSSLPPPAGYSSAAYTGDTGRLATHV